MNRRDHFGAIASIVLPGAIVLIGCTRAITVTDVNRGTLPQPSHERIEVPSDLEPDFAVPIFESPVEVFLPPDDRTRSDRIALLVHLHGASFIPVIAARRSDTPYVVAVVNLGAGSSRYERPFESRGTLERLTSAIADSIAGRSGRQPEIGSTLITSFSAGYGAVRAVLREPANVEQLDRLLLLDGLHEDYDPDGAPVPGGNRIDTTGMQPFLAFARRAVSGEKAMLVTHSAIVPGTYVSTTETADYLIMRLGLRRAAVRRNGPAGMQQTSEASAGRFRVMGFPGDAAPDHLDHIHGLVELLPVLEGM